MKMVFTCQEYINIMCLRSAVGFSGGSDGGGWEHYLSLFFNNAHLLFPFIQWVRSLVAFKSGLSIQY